MSYLYVILACLPLLTCGQFDMQAVAASLFAKIDANNDGNIERPELSVYFAVRIFLHNL